MASAAASRSRAARIVGALVVRARERVLERQVGERCERNLVGQGERPAPAAARWPAPSCSLAFSKSFSRDDRALALVLHLHLGAQHVDAGDQPRRLEVGGLPEERLRGLLLRARDVDPAGGGDRLEIEVDRHQHDQLAGRLDAARLGALVERGGAVVVQRAQIDQRLRQADARVEDVERADDRRVGREAEDGQVDHLPALAERAARRSAAGRRARASARRAPV